MCWKPFSLFSLLFLPQIETSFARQPVLDFNFIFLSERFHGGVRTAVRMCTIDRKLENQTTRCRRSLPNNIPSGPIFSCKKQNKTTHNRRKRNNKECVCSYFLKSLSFRVEYPGSHALSPTHRQTDRQAQACVVIYCQEMSRSCLRSFYRDNNSKLSVGVLTFAISHAESKEPKAKNRPGGSLATTDESISLSLSRCDDEQMLKAKWKVDGACRSRDEVRLLNGADRHRLFHAGLTHLSLSLYVSIVTHWSMIMCRPSYWLRAW